MTEVSAKHRNGPRLVKKERCDYLRPTVLHCTSPDLELANTEYMFPFVSVVDCPQEQMLKSIKQTLVCTGITENAKFSRQLLDATHIDRLNIGPIKTIALNWLQPHEGNIVDFLFRAAPSKTAPRRRIEPVFTWGKLPACQSRSVGESHTYWQAGSLPHAGRPFPAESRLEAIGKFCYLAPLDSSHSP